MSDAELEQMSQRIRDAKAANDLAKLQEQALSDYMRATSGVIGEMARMHAQIILLSGLGRV